MTLLQIFDKPMCCPTGVCGPQVDPVLPTFAADLDWLKQQGIGVERFNLAQQPQAFVAHADVTAALRANPEHALPLVKLDGRIVSEGVYPTRQQLAKWCGVAVKPSLMIVEAGCGPSGATGCC
ncbi:MAG TPA: arsenite efflux transporter metallochaperone ArsD [Pirellulales bacterium]